MTKAAQLSTKKKNGSRTVIGVGDLRVLIIRDGEKEWYAQGLEIDYLAQGDDLASVMDAFQVGLMKTIHEHLKCYGDIVKLLRPAQADVWTEFYQHATAKAMCYSQISTHDLSEIIDDKFTVHETKSARKTRAKAAPQVSVRDAPRSLPFGRIAYLAQQQIAC